MDEAVELTTFTALGDTYVYAPLPPATSYGHRAELWNPDKWMQEVKLKVVTAGDHCFIRLLTRESGELFAECPLPADGTPLITSVEPVVDSSRYFVIKVVDRESSKHAFIGIGFRDRMDASDFTAALDDYRQYLRKRQEAQQLRLEFDALQPPSESGDGAAEGADGSSAGQRDFSLKPGETLHIKLSPSLKRGDSGKGAAGAAGSILRSGSGGSSSPGIVPPPAPGGVPRLAPPGSSTSSSAGNSTSSSGFFRLQPPPPSPVAAAAAGSGSSIAATETSAAAAADSRQQQKAEGQSGAGPGRVSLDEGNAGTGSAAAVAEDDWGDFVG